MTIDAKLKELNITLPDVPKAVANYVGYKVVGNLVVISGQLPFKDGAILHPGHLGDYVSLEQGDRGRPAMCRECSSAT
jgi:enamine deaminase RidA (YjgF/YER057c/UK114 family)